MLFFFGIAAALIFARIVTHGNAVERPDTTGNSMQDAQLERALAHSADELDISLNPTLPEPVRTKMKQQLRAHKTAHAKAHMTSTASVHSRKMATLSGRTRSVHA